MRPRLLGLLRFPFPTRKKKEKTIVLSSDLSLSRSRSFAEEQLSGWLDAKIEDMPPGVDRSAMEASLRQQQPASQPATAAKKSYLVHLVSAFFFFQNSTRAARPPAGSDGEKG